MNKLNNLDDLNDLNDLSNSFNLFKSSRLDFLESNFNFIIENFIEINNLDNKELIKIRNLILNIIIIYFK